MKTQNILQVEDDENDIFLLQYSFKHAEVLAPLVSIKDGQSAIDYLCGSGEFEDRARFPIPSLMLLDLKLPRKSGLEVLKWLRQQPKFQELPVLILTSSSRPGDIRAAYRLGANAYLVKPSGADRLMKVVKSLADFWLGHAQLPILDERDDVR